ncbi:DUF1206 domain-containing protein [Nonomuraea sp. NPDC059194]|uniref:DUF1206 domain-containing protein n=1 Tax=Nonomuraea sp. NPDC059194 TaxID=3346764 RepID=UPI0036CC53B5
MILTKLGYAARALLYALIGLVALQVAFGEGGDADKSGAIHIVAAQPFRSVVLWIMTAGVLIGQAAITYDPDRAVGIDGALKSLADTPAGPWLLVAVAVGLVLFAVYCLAEARWHRT